MPVFIDIKLQFKYTFLPGKQNPIKENGMYRFTGRSPTNIEKGKKLPAVYCEEKQGRFRKISIERLNQLQAWVDARREEYMKSPLQRINQSSG